jgi:hypothetical protein
MMVGIARLLMRVATRSLGETHREWAWAMQAELQAAVDDKRPVRFALGCVVAAWRQMPGQDEGRFILVNYALALGLLVPMAALQLTCAAGFPLLPFGGAAAVAPGTLQQLYLADAHSAAMPALLALWLLLAAGHFRLAWLLLEHEWARLVQSAALVVAASATLVVFTAVLFLDGTGANLQLMLLPVEVAAIYRSARWHERLIANAAARFPAR